MVQISKKSSGRSVFKRMQQNLVLIVAVVGAVSIIYMFLTPSTRKGGDRDRTKAADTNIRSGSGSNAKDTGSMRLGPSILSASSILSSGRPYIIYGTAWKKDETADLVSEAVKSGFRMIDTACQPKHYQEDLVGKGWSEAAATLGLKREDLSLQTKFTSLDGQDPNRIPYDKSASLEDQVKQSLAKSLDNLRTTYLDSLVLHSPMSTHHDTMTVWRTFEGFVDEGKVRRLGVSNCYDPQKFEKIFDEARIKPAVLQNRFYAESGFDVKLRNFCKKHDVKYQSFWTLSANRKALATPQIKELAQSKGLTPQTLMYAYMLLNGHTPLDGTTNKGHMDEDIAIMKRVFEGEQIFDEEEMALIGKILGIPDQ